MSQPRLDSAQFDDQLFDHMNPAEEAEANQIDEERDEMEDCPDHLEHTSRLEEEQ